MSQTRPLGTHLFKGVTSLYTAQIVTIPLSIVTNLLVGQLLDPSEYGLFATASFVVGFAAILNGAGLTNALIREPGEVGEREYSFVFVYQAFVGLILGALLIAGASLTTVIFKDYAAAAPMIRWLAIIPFLNSFIAIPLIRMERELQYQKVATLSMIWGVAERLLLVLFMVGHFGAFSYVFSRVSGVLIQLAMLGYFARWSPWALVRSALVSGVQGMHLLRFGLTVQVKSFSVTLVQSVIPVMGGAMFTPAQVGLVAWSHNMATTLGQPLPQSVGRVFLSAARRFKDVPEQMKQFFERSVLFSTIFVSLLLAVLATTFPETLTILFKPKWRDAAPYFAISSVVMVEAILLVLYDALMDAIGFPMLNVIATWVWGILSVVFCWTLAHFLGPRGLLYGYIVSILVPILMLHYRGRRHFGFGFGLFRNFFLPVLISAAVAFLALRLKGVAIHGLPTLILFDGTMFLGGLAVHVLVHPELLSVVRNFIDQRKAPKLST